MYQAQSGLIERTHPYTTPNNNWWERSPNGSNSSNFCNVNNGSPNNNNATNANGVAPFGCIGATGLDGGVATDSETKPYHV